MKTARTAFAVLALLAFAGGAGLIALWLLLDLDGFLKGLCQGAAFTLLALSTFVAVRSLHQGGKGGGSADWLPSRDGSGSTGWLPGRDGGERP